jgi:hypothetical protein
MMNSSVLTVDSTLPLTHRQPIHACANEGGAPTPGWTYRNDANQGRPRRGNYYS